MAKMENGSAASQNGARNARAEFRVEQKRKFGPVRKRSCTDLLCLFLFIAFLAAWGYMILFFYRNVDIERTLNPTDIYGNACGKGKFKDRKYLAFFNILTCATSLDASIIDGCKTPQVCVESCPNITFSINKDSSADVKEEEAKNAICLYDVNPSGANIYQLVQEGKCARYYFNSDPVGGRCLPSVLKIIGQHGIVINELTQGGMENEKGGTISTNELLQNNEVIATLMKALAFGTKIASDIAKTWKWIIMGLVVVMLVAFLWIYLMQFLARYMIWLSIFAIFIINAAGLWYCAGEYMRLNNPPNGTYLTGENASLQYSAFVKSAFSEMPEEDAQSFKKYIRGDPSAAGSSDGLKFDLNLNEKLHDELNSYRNNPTTWMVGSIVTGVLLLITILTMFCCCQRIKLAIAVIEEASKAVNSMKSTLFFPIVPYILKISVLTLWVFAVIIIASGSHPQYRFANGTFCVPEQLSPEHQKHLGQTFQSSPHPNDTDCQFTRPFERKWVYAAHAFNLFGIIWMLFFLMGVCYMTLSGAFASYYWTFNKDEVPFFALLGSFFRCLRYHLGSIAFGSLLVAVVRFIRIILEYIDKKCKKYADNPVAKAVMCLLRCCFWCLENFIKFINKNAFIMIAIYGKNFCASAKDAFLLLTENVLRAAVLDSVSVCLLIISKLAVTGIVGVGGFFVFTNRAEFLVKFDGLNYFWAPLTLFVILSYIVTSTFFNVYDVGIETIFMCYLEDSKVNDGSRERPYYMTKSLGKVFKKFNK